MTSGIFTGSDPLIPWLNQGEQTPIENVPDDKGLLRADVEPTFGEAPDYAAEDNINYTIDDAGQHWVADYRGDHGPFQSREEAAAWDQERRRQLRAGGEGSIPIKDREPAGKPVARLPTGRIMYQDNEGQFYSEKTETIQSPDGKWRNIPTIGGSGKQLTSREAMYDVNQYRAEEGSGSMSIWGSDEYRDPQTDRVLEGFETREEAEAAAQARSDSIEVPQLIEPDGTPVFGSEIDALGEESMAGGSDLREWDADVTPGKFGRRFNQHLMDMLERGVSTPHDAMTGELEVIGPDGKPTKEAMLRAFEMTMTSIGIGGVAQFVESGLMQDFARGRLASAGRGIKDQIGVKRRVRPNAGYLAANEPGTKGLALASSEFLKRGLETRPAISGVGLPQQEGLAAGGGGIGQDQPASYGGEHQTGSIEQGYTGTDVRLPTEVGTGSPHVDHAAAQKAYEDSSSFFSGITTGDPATQSQIPWDFPNVYEPVINLRGQEATFDQVRSQYKGHFEHHIAASIPGHPEVQSSVGSAIVRTYGKTGADVLDIGASEGALNKAVSKASKGKIKTVALEPNLDFKATFEGKPQAKGASFESAAFGTAEQAGKVAFDHEGVPIHYYDSKGKKFDVIHESMTFQFIDAERLKKFGRVKELLKDDGIALFEQKVRDDGTDQWAMAEEAKNRFKLKHFTEEQLSQKQEVALVGMNEKMVPKLELEQSLKDTFKHVRQYWDSGNFKGYIAGESEAAIESFINNMQDTTTKFSGQNFGFKLSANPKEAAHLALVASRRKILQGPSGIFPKQESVAGKSHGRTAFNLLRNGWKKTEIPDAHKGKETTEAAFDYIKRQFDKGKKVEMEAIADAWLEEITPEKLPSHILNDPPNALNVYENAVLDAYSRWVKKDQDTKIGEVVDLAKKTVTSVTPKKVDTALSTFDLTELSGSQGSHPGGFFQDGGGETWYVKDLQSDMAANEALAADLYEELGVYYPTTELVTDNLNKVFGVASRRITNSWQIHDKEAKVLTPDEFNKLPKATRNAFIKDAVVDMYLGNWDAIGNAPNFNIVLQKISKGAEVVRRIDAGGALGYRAMGEKKVLKHDLPEMASMVDPIKAKTGFEVYHSKLTSKEFWNLQKDAMKRIIEAPWGEIEGIVQASGVENPNELLAALVSRRGVIRAKYDELFGPDKLPIEKIYATKVDKLLDAMNIYSDTYDGGTSFTFDEVGSPWRQALWMMGRYGGLTPAFHEYVAATEGQGTVNTKEITAAAHKIRDIILNEPANLDAMVKKYYQYPPTAKSPVYETSPDSEYKTAFAQGATNKALVKSKKEYQAVKEQEVTTQDKGMSDKAKDAPHKELKISGQEYEPSSYLSIQEAIKDYRDQPLGFWSKPEDLTKMIKYSQSYLPKSKGGPDVMIHPLVHPKSRFRLAKQIAVDIAARLREKSSEDNPLVVAQMYDLIKRRGLDYENVRLQRKIILPHDIESMRIIRDSLMRKSDYMHSGKNIRKGMEAFIAHEIRRGVRMFTNNRAGFRDWVKRMKKAKAGGLDAMGYHGSRSPHKIQYFDLSFSDYSKQRAVFAGSGPKIGEGYGSSDHVFPLMIKTENFAVIDFLKTEGRVKNYGASWLEPAIEEAMKAGKDGLIVRGMSDVGGEHDQYIIWNVKGTMRSPNAKFEDLESEFLLAANPKEAAGLSVIMRRKLDKMGFYSPTLEAAKQLQPKGRLADMKKALTKKGAKPKEIEDTGLDKFFEAKEEAHKGQNTQLTVTRDEIVKHLEENRIEPSEVTLGKFPDYDDLEEAVYEIRDNEERRLRNDEFTIEKHEVPDGKGGTKEEHLIYQNGMHVDGYKTIEEATEALDEIVSDIAAENMGNEPPFSTAYDSYAVSHQIGNYTERLFHIPGAKTDFAGHHWSNEGIELPIFAHQRVTYYTHPQEGGLPDKTTYHVNEYQSDMADDYRDSGGGANNAVDMVERDNWLKEAEGHEQLLLEMNREAIDLLKKIIHQGDMPVPDNDGWKTSSTRALEALPNMAASTSSAGYRVKAENLITKSSQSKLRIAEISNKLDTGKIGAHPFVRTTDSYTEFLVRASILDAAKKGFDRITWTTPEEITLASFGDLEGNRYYYGDKIVPKAIQKAIREFGPEAKITMTNAPSGRPVIEPKGPAGTEAEVDEAYFQQGRIGDLINTQLTRLESAVIDGEKATGLEGSEHLVKDYPLEEELELRARDVLRDVGQLLPDELRAALKKEVFELEYLQSQLEDRRNIVTGDSSQYGSLGHAGLKELDDRYKSGDVFKNEDHSPAGSESRFQNAHGYKLDRTMESGNRYGTAEEAYAAMDKANEPFERENYMALEMSPELRETIMKKGISLYANNPKAAAGMIVALRDAESAAQAMSVGLRQSIAGGMKSPVVGTGRGGKIVIRDLAKHFDKKTIEKYGRKLDPESRPEDMKTMINTAVEEINYQRSRPITGEGWYSSDINKAFELVAQIVPRIAESEPLRVLMTAMTSISSGQRLSIENWQIGTKMLEAYERDGLVPPINPENGKHWGRDITNQVSVLNQLITSMGEFGAAEWLLTRHPVSEMREMQVAGGYAKGTVPGKAGDMKLGFNIFGPKYGPFGLAMNGFQETVTDVWNTRSFNRQMGRLTDKQKGHTGPTIEEPRNATERELMKQWNVEAAGKTGLTEVDNQAVQWYYEQQLYTDLGVKSDPQGFSKGAEIALEKRDLPVPRGSVRTSDESKASGQRKGAEGSLYANPKEAAGLAVAMTDRSPLGFYSRAQQAAKKIKQKKGPPHIMMKRLKSSGVPDEEIKWTGLDQWMEGRKMVSKDEIETYLLDNRIQIEKHLKTGPNVGHEGLSTQGVPLSTPGGSDYRELVFEYVPQKPGKVLFRSTHFKEPNIVGHTRVQDYRVIVDNPVPDDALKVKTDRAKYAQEIEKWKRDTKAWRGRHFRALNQVTDANGPEAAGMASKVAGPRPTKPVPPLEESIALNVEEMQSDWAQYGRDHGFKEGSSKAKNARDTEIGGKNEKIVKLIKKEHDLRMRVMDIKQKIPGARMTSKQVETFDAMDGELKSIKKEMSELRKETTALREMRIPAEEGPLVQKTSQWVEFLAKALLTEAVEGGYSYIALPTGESQAFRYGLEGGDAEGMLTFYNGIVHGVFNKILKGIDPDSKIGGGRLDGVSRDQVGIIRITGAVKEAVKEGLSLMSSGVPFTTERENEIRPIDHDPFNLSDDQINAKNKSAQAGRRR